MIRLIALATLLAIVSLGNAQFVGFSYEVETTFSPNLPSDDPLAELAGYSTFRVYAEFESETDALSSLYADVIALGTGTMGIDAPCGCFDIFDGTPTVDSLLHSPSVFEAIPTAQYDSFYTIGIASSLDEGSFPESVGIPSQALCAGPVIDNGAVFVAGIPPNAIAGEDLKVLVAQITTCGDLTFQACVQVFEGGSFAGVALDCGELHIPFAPPFGCMDDQACNYSPDATESDDSCDYSCCPGPGCCLDGQHWDWELNGCVITNPSDANFDGCVQLEDLLDLLSVYGSCGDE